MNSVTLFGRLGKDPEVLQTKAGKAICKFSLATSEGKDIPPTWHNIVAFDKAADILNKYLNKGDQLLVIGKIANQQYTNKEGNKVNYSSVIVDKFEFVSKPKNTNTDDEASKYESSPAKSDDLPF